MPAASATSRHTSRLRRARAHIDPRSCPVTITRPKLRTEAPFVCASRSITTTRSPRRAPARAVASPTMPAPTPARSNRSDHWLRVIESRKWKIGFQYTKAGSTLATAGRCVSSAVSRACAHLMGRAPQPVGIDLHAPARCGRNRHVAIADRKRIAEEQAFLPGVVIGSLDRELEVLSRIRNRAQKVHRANRDERQVGAVRRAG